MTDTRDTQDPPAEWLDHILRDLAREGSADPLIEKPEDHVCWIAADRLEEAAAEIARLRAEIERKDAALFETRAWLLLPENMDLTGSDRIHGLVDDALLAPPALSAGHHPTNSVAEPAHHGPAGDSGSDQGNAGSSPAALTKIKITLEWRDDGGLRVLSDDLSGLILSHPDPDLLMKDVLPAIRVLIDHRARSVEKRPPALTTSK